MENITDDSVFALLETLTQLAVEAELEDFAARTTPIFGLNSDPLSGSGVVEYVNWWSDGEDSRFCM